MNKFILDKNFWEILMEIDRRKDPILFENIIQKYHIKESEIFEMISYLDSFGYKVTVNSLLGKKILKGPDEKVKINFNLSFIEWMAMQAHFPAMSKESDRPYHQVLAKKLGEVELKYPDLDLYSTKYQNCHEFIEIIKNSVEENSSLNIKLLQGKNLEVFPHQLVFIDGKLSLVGEETNDRCLVYFEVEAINNISVSETSDYIANFGSVEVNDFVMALRSVEGKEVRLILKVKSLAENVDLKPEYHLLGNPYVTCNMEGDFIWAATVEVSQELFDWLDSIYQYIEILDPEDIKEQLLEYMDKSKSYSMAS